MNKVVVITGSTKGAGLGMARSLLEQGYSVAISSENKSNVIKALQALKPSYGTKIWGAVCAVEDYRAVQELWNMAKAYFGHIHVWINNAGFTCKRCKTWEMDPNTMYDMINTNMTGTMNGVNVAVSGMLQQGGGQIFNMDGEGGQRKGHCLHDSTKLAIRYITEVLSAELKGKPVTAGVLSAGKLPRIN